MILAQNSTGINSIAQFFSVLLIFLGVLALTYFTTRWVASYQKGKMTTQNIEIIETNKISNNKYIQIIKVGKKYLALAICKDSVSLLCEIDEEDIELPQPGEQQPLPDFKQILEKAKNMKPKK